jgi:hypothetical protein
MSNVPAGGIFVVQAKKGNTIRVLGCRYASRERGRRGRKRTRPGWTVTLTDRHLTAHRLGTVQQRAEVVRRYEAGLPSFTALWATKSCRCVAGGDHLSQGEKPWCVGLLVALANVLFHERDGMIFNQHYNGDGSVIHKHACALGCERIVSKRLGSPYRSGRTPAVKREAEED